MPDGTFFILSEINIGSKQVVTNSQGMDNSGIVLCNCVVVLLVIIVGALSKNKCMSNK